ncbi:E3 ubiquitin-protein ligase TRIM21-like [Melanotaenia boesemani]|uniref:E3 ubiquitin-protein ligase TRIM21-like n=1 Tax=Melanotaenia boesemani TaxID=1250792 RepID=UPI001C057368|nr:E3 ubiquitin-protein ligase TRIM21-like [Melanotaenia boesemani]
MNQLHLLFLQFPQHLRVSAEHSADMSAAGSRLTEDQLLCSICLEVFTDPVSTPCGHNFCKACITQHLSKDVPFQCPICQKMFFPKPELQVNTLMAEMVDVFRRSAGGGGPDQAADPAELHCDSCSGTKRKALVFCVLWAFVCVVFSQHELPLTQENLQEVIEDIRMKMEEVKLSLQLSKEDACGHQTTGSLKESVDRVLQELTEKQRTSEMEMEQKFAEMMKREIPKLLMRVELMKVQHYTVDVTLDPETPCPQLIVSDDGKQVRCCDASLLYNPWRCAYHAHVLGRQSFFSGKFYFEVQVKGKTEWTLGVTQETVNRRGDVPLRPQDGYWTIWLRNRSEYRALAAPPVRLSLQSPPEKVGVFVDYEEGLVFFYDVDAAALIFSFTGCSFTERLHPFFDPGLNDDGENFAPLIITPVRHME